MGFLSTGAIAADYDLDAFRTWTQGVRTIEQRYGHTGREHDAETGLIYYRARHYDPATGQFIQRDPIGFAAGNLNLYAHVENDPYNWTDPTGLVATTDYARLTGTLVGSGILIGILNALQSALQDIDFGASVFSKPIDRSDSSSTTSASNAPSSNSNCDPADPDCEEHCFEGEDDYLDALEHFDDELLDMDDGFDWRRVIDEGEKFFDTETGNHVHVLDGNAVVVDEDGALRTTFDNVSNKNKNERQATGRWQKCND